MATESLDAMVRVYRGWHELERRTGGPAIVDSDLAPGNIPSDRFESRIAVLAALEELAGRLPSEHRFLIDRVRASVATLRALLGQQFEFPRYIRETLGLDAAALPEDVVERQRGVVVRILERAGLGLDRASAARVRKRFTTDIEGDELREWLKTAATRDLERARKLLALDLDPDFQFEFCSSAAYWKGWSSVSLDEPVRIQFNITPRNPYLRGDAFLLAHHEVGGHGLQMQSWRRRIRQGDLHPAYGVTVVHCFEQFLYEGVAQTLTDLVFEDAELNDDILWAREYPRYCSYVYQRAHLEMNLGVDARAVFQYLREALPFEQDATLETEMHSRCLDPVFRCYQFVYAPSDSLLLASLRAWGKSAFLDFVRSLYLGPRTIEDVLSTLSSQSASAGR